MLTRDNFEDTLNLLSDDDKQLILDSDSEYCVVHVSTFNVGCVVTLDYTTDNYKEAEYPTYILNTNEVQEILTK